MKDEFWTVNKNQLISVFGAILTLFIIESCGLHKKTQSKTSKVENLNHSTDVRSKYAEIIGVPASTLTNKALYNFIDDWYGVSYRFGGNDKNGVDCSGFAGALYSEVYHKNIPRTTGEIAKQSKKISKEKLQEGDLVFFDINGKKGSHMGVYLTNGKFVHASTSKGVIISDLNNPYYQKAYGFGARI